MLLRKPTRRGVNKNFGSINLETGKKAVSYAYKVFVRAACNTFMCMGIDIARSLCTFYVCITASYQHAHNF